MAAKSSNYPTALENDFQLLWTQIWSLKTSIND